MSQCTATSKRSKERCKRFCAPGKKVCCIHGGKSNGAPKGNKNAFKHGAFEAISLATMTEEEVAYARYVSTDAGTTFEEQLRILRVREKRLLERIQKTLRQEALAGQDDGSGKKNAAFVVISGTQTISMNAAGEQTKTIATQNESHGVHILRLENALTQIQDQIRRVVDNLAKFRETSGEDYKPLPLYTESPYAEV